jgi:acetylglutamate/LysW-gamma-L-alpha-aminoadipate kinase
MTIIKIGGGQEINLDYLVEDLKCLIDNQKLKEIIIVVGANYYRNQLAQKLNIEIKIIESESGYKSVYTNQEVIDLMLMTYPGLMAKKLTAKLNQNHIKAISLSGIDGFLLLAKRKKIITAKVNDKIKLITDSYTGKIEKINKNLIDYFLNNNYLLVITPPALSDEGEIVNVDNDQIVYCLSEKYLPEKVIFLIEAPGILADKNKEDSLINQMNLNDLDNFIKKTNDYGFQKKLLYLKKLAELKIKEIIITDGRQKQPLSQALINHQGTLIISND